MSDDWRWPPAQPDIVDIATLTGAALRALGTRVAALFGTTRRLSPRSAAGRRTDEFIWQLPSKKRHAACRSDIADFTNTGGRSGGSSTAGMFLKEVTGGLPWAHIDIAGTMSAGADDAWRPRGATGFGARLLLDLACNFAPPAA
jgi:leucyl aminopeptidase